MSQLEPCPHCQRHVRTSETSCPFCGAEIAAAMSAMQPRQLPRTRLSRAALLAFGLGVAASTLTGCADETDDGSGRSDDGDDDDDDDDASTRDDGGRVTPVYGAPVQPRDASADASRSNLDAGRDAASEAGAASDAAASDARAADAASAVDAAADGGADAGRRFDAGNVVALYGVPPAPSREDLGNSKPIYGAPVTKLPSSS
jgi:hypothetical protein